MKLNKKIIFIVAFCFLALLPVNSEAHSNYVSSNPPANAILTQEPSNVTIIFSEPPDPSTIYIKVYLSNGYEIDNLQNALISLDNPNEAYTPLVTPPAIQVNFTYDVYTVIWSTNSATDGHFTTGQFSFAVQYPNGTLPGLTNFKTISPSGNYLNIDLFSKFIAITVMIVVLMDNILIFFVDKSVFKGTFSGKEETKVKYYKQFMRIGYLGSIAYFISMILWFVTEAIALESQHLAHVGNNYITAFLLIFDPNTIFEPFYFGLVVRIAISLIMVLLAWFYYLRLSKKRYKFYSYFHLIMIVFLVLSIIIESITTHAGTAPQWYLTVPIDVLHYFAVSVWAGGTILVAIVYYINRNDFEEDFQKEFSRAFGSIVNLSINMILVTGTLLALFLVAVPLISITFASVFWTLATIAFIIIRNFYKKKATPISNSSFMSKYMLDFLELVYVIILIVPVFFLFFNGSLDNFFSTIYGQVIILKILLFGVILLFGPYNRSVLIKISKGIIPYKKFVKNINMEAGLALIIIFLAVTLSYLNPPLLIPPNTSSQSLDQFSDNVKVTLSVSPQPVYVAVYNFTIFLYNQPNNTFYNLATNCTIAFQNIQKNSPVETIQLNQIKPYEYSIISSAMSQPGVWRLDITVSRIALVDILVTFNFDIFAH